MGDLWTIVLIVVAAVAVGLVLVHLDNWNDLDN